ncbi:MAG: hypothetical protein IK077_17270, partial [Thermoguttaceae bacterium]|nr:hypothetical protein [Thermoguttaceae bacterium]
LEESVQKKANTTINYNVKEFSRHGSAPNRRLTLSGNCRAFFEIVGTVGRLSAAAVASRRRLTALRADTGSDVLSKAILRVNQRRRHNNQNAPRAKRGEPSTGIDVRLVRADKTND